MTTGFFATALACLALGQSADAYHTKERNLAIPAEIPEARWPSIRNVLLYSSKDQGRTWELSASKTPDKKNFAFYASGDGAYWFRVAIVGTDGKQDPDDRSLKNGTPDMTLTIDTVQPVVKSFQAQRSGDEVLVTWDVQEDHPDPGLDGLRIEYQVKDSPADAWTPIPAQPALRGQTTFRPTTNQALTLRLTARDRAKNQSFGMAEVAGTVAAAGFSVQGNIGDRQKKTPTPVLPSDIQVPVDRGPVLPPPPMGGMPIQQPIEVNPPASLIMPPPNADVFTEKSQSLKPAENVIAPPPKRDAPTEKVVADSRIPPPEVKPPQRDPRGAPPSDGMLDVKPIATAAPARKPLPPLTYVRIHQVLLQYQLSRVGPSGIGGVELWLTKDDGETWERYAEDKDAGAGPPQRHQERTFDLRDRATDAPFPDGIYGMALVVKNRAGLGKQPRPGDLPEIRIELDTTRPTAQLFQPIADPQHPDQLLIKWSASDKNLTATPIHLEYAEKREGPWQPIKLDLENSGQYTNQHVTGDFSWKVPPNIPVQVYLRIRVQDKAGNEVHAVTENPQFVDLIEPEGRLIGVQPQTGR